MSSWEYSHPTPKAHPIILTNGRADCFRQMRSSLVNVIGIEPGTVIDDSGSPDYRDWVRAQMPGWDVVPVSYSGPQGYSAAMQYLWGVAAGYEYFFLIEDDFVFERPVFTSVLVELLIEHPHLAQLVLLRQPWFGNEVEHGGLLEAIAARGERVVYRPEWVEQRATWSCNPTVIRGGWWVRDHPWPYGAGSEYRFGRELFARDANAVTAWYGDGKTPWVRHVGERSGFGH